MRLDGSVFSELPHGAESRLQRLGAFLVGVVILVGACSREPDRFLQPGELGQRLASAEILTTRLLERAGLSSEAALTDKVEEFLSERRHGAPSDASDCLALGATFHAEAALVLQASLSFLAVEKGRVPTLFQRVDTLASLQQGLLDANAFEPMLPRLLRLQEARIDARLVFEKLAGFSDDDLQQVYDEILGEGQLEAAILEPSSSPLRRYVALTVSLDQIYFTVLVNLCFRPVERAGRLADVDLAFGLGERTA